MLAAKLWHLFSEAPLFLLKLPKFLDQTKILKIKIKTKINFLLSSSKTVQVDSHKCFSLNLPLQPKTAFIWSDLAVEIASIQVHFHLLTKWQILHRKSFMSPKIAKMKTKRIISRWMASNNRTILSKKIKKKARNRIAIQVEILLPKVVTINECLI